MGHKEKNHLSLLILDWHNVQETPELRSCGEDKREITVVDPALQLICECVKVKFHSLSVFGFEGQTSVQISREVFLPNVFVRDVR